MDERPETGGDWMNLVNKRLSRLERRLRSPNTPPLGAVFLVPDDPLPEGWDTVADLAGDAPSGWVYVQRAQPQEDP